MKKLSEELSSLIISCLLFMIASGLVNILLPVRMKAEAMPIDTIGLVLSLFFVGMVAGSLVSKSLIKRCGHIRMFTGAVALAAVSILACGLVSNPVLYGLMRILTGFSSACAFTAIESWLNGVSDNTNRGKILSIYNATILGGLFLGQFLLVLAPPESNELLMVACIIFCIAVLPITWSRQPGPDISDTQHMSLGSLYQRSPLGVVACFTSGLVYSSVFSLLPIYASEYGFEGGQLALFVAMAALGALLLQFPFGVLSDRFDRRKVLISVLVIATLSGLIIDYAIDNQLYPLSLLGVAVSAGIITCIYPLSIAEAFDKLRPNEMVGAMSSLLLIFSVGGIVGPYSFSLLMESLGNTTLFYQSGAVMLSLAGFTFWRMSQRQALPVEEQQDFIVQSCGVPPATELDPRIEEVGAEVNELEQS